jgi:hypothetical protein
MPIEDWNMTALVEALAAERDKKRLNAEKATQLTSVPTLCRFDAGRVTVVPKPID